jgi:exopolyphosphatase/guanosine-5'-triphosphate,3'-diphosphate pyrophosphatase
MRVAYLLSAAMPGILPRAPMLARGDSVVLTVPRDLADLVNERVHSRLRQLCRQIGRDPVVEFTA